MKLETHNAPRMAGMEDPAQGLGEVIRGVDDTRDVAHDDVASLQQVVGRDPLAPVFLAVFGSVMGRWAHSAAHPSSKLVPVPSFAPPLTV